MSLYKFTSSRFCKSVAGFLFGVMILSACQETAQQVVNKPIPIEQDKIASLQEQASTFKERAIKGDLTADEKEMVTAFVQAPATKKLIEINNAATLRLYNAVQAGKGEAIEKAFQEEREEEALHLLGYSKQEMGQIIAEVQITQRELMNQMGKSKDLFMSYAKVNSGVCGTCSNKEQFNNTIQSMKTADMSKLLLPTPPANLKAGFDTKAVTLQGCSWAEWWNILAYSSWVLLCYSGFVLCIAAGAAIGSPAGPVGIALGGIIAFFPCAAGADECVRSGRCLICNECN